MSNVKIKTFDGVVCTVEGPILKVSEFLKGESEKSLPKDFVMEFKEMTFTCYRKVLEWVEYHKHDPILPKQDDLNYVVYRSDDISEWDAAYMPTEHESIFAIMHAAHLLGIQGLFDLTSKVVANLMGDKTGPEIAELFNL